MLLRCWRRRARRTGRAARTRRIKDLYRTMGRYDVAAIIEAPDDVAMSAIAYSLGSAGNVRTETLRAFTRQETDTALNKMA